MVQLQLSKTFIFLFALCAFLAAQQNSEQILVTGDQLNGRVENGQSVREVIGNVVLKQGNVVINCERAIQYLMQNNAHLIGNVIVKQDTLTIKTPEGYYYGNERRAYSNAGVELNDKKIILTAFEGEYFFKEQRAFFRQHVKLYDTASTLTSEKLLYYRTINKAVAYQRVKIVESDNTIYSDSLIYLRSEKISYAFENTILQNKADALVIFGNHLEDYRKKSFSIVDKDPLLVQLDTMYNDKKDSVIKIDTLVIKSLKLEARRDSTNLFIATDSVKIIRGDFSSRNDITYYNRQKEYIDIWKTSDSAKVPVLWFTLSQMTGDSIRINLSDNKIKLVNIKKNAMILSRNEKYTSRYDQLSGSNIKLHFDNNKLTRTEIEGNALSYYYFYDEEEPSGIMKSSAKSIVAFFNDNKVDDVKMYGDPRSEFHPENLVEGKEKQFSLPGFTIYSDKPVKEKLIQQQHYRFLENKLK